jgi:hypothetical protein
MNRAINLPGLADCPAVIADSGFTIRIPFRISITFRRVPHGPTRWRFDASRRRLQRFIVLNQMEVG